MNNMLFSIDYYNVLKEDDSVMILEGWIVSEGSNRNNTYFPLDAIKDAYLSVLNKPILCIFDGFDFKEHARNNVTARNIQRIGTVPESSNGEIVERDGKNWQKIDVIIWKPYNQEIINRLKTNDNVK